MTVIYARQVEEAGWLGLVGYLLFGLFPLLTIALVSAEAFILPLLATQAPTFVDGFMGLYGGYASGVNLGALRALSALTGVAVLLGCLLRGVATLGAVVAGSGPVDDGMLTARPGSCATIRS